MVSSSGFLGPIGDDLPSLIPLTFALILFFSTFTFAFNSFEKRNSYFRDSLSILGIASGLKQDSYIVGHESFSNLCDGLKSSRLNFKAGLVDLNKFGSANAGGKPWGLKIENLDNDFYKIEEMPDVDGGCVLVSVPKVFSCTNSTESPKSNSGNLLLRLYPVSLETHDCETKSGFAVKPMLLVVVIWKD